MHATLYRILIDSCIWLDLAKSYRAAPLVRALTEMCDNAQLEIIVPDIVLEEFHKNKNRVLTESSKGIQSNIKMLKNALPSFADEKTRAEVLGALENLDVTRTPVENTSIVDQVERLLQHPENIHVETTMFHMSRAARRALWKEAPCHRDRNSIADAIIFEIFDELRSEPHDQHTGYGLATTNYKDFSEQSGDNHLPHSDLKYAFSDGALFIVDLARFVEDHAPGFQGIFDLEEGLVSEFRNISDLIEAEGKLFYKVWYNRHMIQRSKIEHGLIRIVPDDEVQYEPNGVEQIPETIWHTALASAKRIENEIGTENLGPWDDFDWGLINGKLSAIRWVLGDEWDMLDT